MSEHSEGPWTYKETNNGRLVILNADGTPLADVWSFDDIGDDALRANATLIAAAPDLLAACELGQDGDLLRWAAAICEHYGYQTQAAALRAKADAEDAAAQRARGTTP
jgi:hypothetical protein